jgi:predicted ATPase
MRAAIAWSYDLLTPNEQTLFRRLAVFAAGCTLAAVDDVTGGPTELGIDPLDGVSSLLDKSLLRREDGPAGELRLTMLETVREFPREQLAASGEERAIRERHAAWCLALAETSANSVIPLRNLHDALAQEEAQDSATLDESGDDRSETSRKGRRHAPWNQ